MTLNGSDSIQVEPYNHRALTMEMTFNSLAKSVQNIQFLKCFKELPKHIIGAHNRLVQSIQKVSKIDMKLTGLKVKHTDHVHQYTENVRKGNKLLLSLGEKLQHGKMCLL